MVLEKVSNENDLNISLDQIIENLRGIELCDTPEENYKDYVNENFISNLLSKLKNPKVIDDSLYSILQIIAEIAKTDIGRNMCQKKELFTHLTEYLLKYEGNENKNISYQACRVLGNVCYDSDEARTIAYEAKCHISLLNLLNFLCDTLKETSNSSQHSATANPIDGFPTFAHKHLKTAASAFMNLVFDHDKLQIAVLEEGLMDVLSKMMAYPVCSDVLLDVCFSIIEFYDLSHSKLKEFVTSEKTHELFLEIIKSSQDQQTIDSLFQSLGTFSEDNDVKLNLCRSGFVEKLIGILDSWEGTDAGRNTEKQEGSIKVVELINDFIVLLLTGDESMAQLFEGGESAVYKCIRSWLHVDRPLKLQTAGVFAMCNIARSDENCRKLISSGIVKELLELLDLYPITSQNHVIQHAVFGTFVNLAISPADKGDLDGVLEACLTFSSTSSLTVLFKILACVRLMTNKTETLVKKVVNDDAFMKVLDASVCNDHKGIMCEALRLNSCMIRSTSDSQILEKINRFNGIINILKLLDCEHFIMKNEALLALIHLLLRRPNDISYPEAFCKEILERLKNILLSESSKPESEEPSSNNLTPSQNPIEVICNALNLVVLSKNIMTLNDDFNKANLYALVREKYKMYNDEKIKKVYTNI